MKIRDYDNDNRKGWIVAVLFIVLVGSFFHYRYLNEFPTYIHAWAQSDWYAISLGYLDNGFDFFHPQSMLLNKQFPSWWQEASDNSITATDFPIHEYIVALFMRLFGTTSPWVFRLWTLVISLAGMVFLYKACLLITDDWVKSLSVVAIAMTAPVYVYYAAGFLPGIPAFSVATAGLCTYLKYYKHQKKVFFHLSVGLFTLAMLIRTTFAIVFVAFILFEAIRIIKKESTLRDKIASVAIAIFLYAAYYAWNSHLRSRYGSLFLNELLPPRNLDDVNEVFQDVREKWAFQYLLKLQHYVILAVIIFSALWQIFLKTKKKENTNAPSPLSLWWFWGIYTFGCLLFCAAMMRQFSDHDYYFIDSLFLPILLLFALALGGLPKIRHWAVAASACLVLAGLTWPMITETQHLQQQRRWNGDRSLICYQHFKGSDSFLDHAGVAKDAKILVLFGYPQNGPLIQMHRKGFAVMQDKDNLLRTSLYFDFDYIIIENEVFAEAFDAHQDVLQRLKPLAQNTDLTLCTLSDTIINSLPEDFLNMTKINHQ